MTIQLTVHEARWLAHVQSVARATPGLVPVVKGNAYGFRRWNLMPLASQLSREIAVGTVFEVRDIPSGVTLFDLRIAQAAKCAPKESVTETRKPLQVHRSGLILAKCIFPSLCLGLIRLQTL